MEMDRAFSSGNAQDITMGSKNLKNSTLSANRFFTEGSTDMARESEIERHVADLYQGRKKWIAGIDEDRLNRLQRELEKQVWLISFCMWLPLF